MRLRPVVFGVRMAWFPAGHVLDWLTDGALGLHQQWWKLQKHGERARKAAPSK